MRFPSVLRLVVLVLATLGVVRTPAATAQSDDLDRWVAQLDADEFAVRESATRRLVDLGEDAIEPVTRIVRQGSSEQRTRGIFVLREIAARELLDSGTPARLALEELERSGTPLIQRRIRAEMAYLDEIRQAKALVMLKERGAVQKDRLAVADQFTNSAGGYAIILNETWRGEPEDLELLGFLSGMVGLQLTGKWVDDAVIERIARVEQLMLISIRKASITDGAVDTLAGMSNLEGIEFRYCRIGDGCLEAMRRFQFLNRLKLIGTDVTADAADELRELFGAVVVDYRLGGFLGVQCTTRDERCYVIQVVEGSTAAGIGMEANDMIRKVDETEITSSDQLIETISKYPEGAKVKLTWQHRGSETVSEVTLGEYEDLD